MTHKIILFAIFLISLGLFGCAAGGYSQNAKDRSMQRDTLRRMSQQDIINLSKAGVSDSLIIGMMDATNTWFQLKAQDVIDLRNSGVSEKVITAMMEEPQPTSNQSGASNTVRYYGYPPYYWWYDGFYPYWYYPRFSARFGYGGFHAFHHGRFH